MRIKAFKWLQRREGSIRGAKEIKFWNIIQSVVLGIWNAAEVDLIEENQRIPIATMLLMVTLTSIMEQCVREDGESW